MGTRSAQGSAAPPSMRKDRLRNRDAILDSARRVFIEQGVLAPLDEIARRAGVGSATLYRHFPTRDELVFAAIERDIGAIGEDAERRRGSPQPAEALQAWLIELVWHLRTWHGLPEAVIDALNTASPLATACAPLQQHTEALLREAQAAGAADPGATAEALFQLATLLSWGADRYDDDEAAARARTEQALRGVLV